MYRFVCRPQTLTPPLIRAAAEAGFRLVCDLSANRTAETGSDPLRQKETRTVADYYLDAAGPVPTPHDLLVLLEKSGPEAILWVEAAGLPTALCRQLHRAASERLGWVVASSAVFDGLRSAVPDARRFALKGNEAAGFVGTDTAFTLFAAVRDRLGRTGEMPEIHIWGGVASPEAAAAFLTSGAAGIVFESLHWLTDQAGIPEQARKKLEKLRADHSRIVGLSSGMPYRLFDRGNSAAARSAAAILEGGGDGDVFRQHLRSHAVPVHAARFDRRELIPLGTEAAFAAAFVRRFGRDLAEAVRKFRAAAEALGRRRAEITGRFADSAVARAWGTRFPFVQGAMSWITDVPEFAARIAGAGALPTIALGLMDPATLRQKLDGLRERLGGRPYAVNILTLPENPYRQAQLAWILEQRPRFAVVAAGEPAQGKPLLDAGVDAFYIAPDENLLQLALETGYRHIVCEGCESGGHLGPHSTLTLAQLAIDLKDRRPDLFRDAVLILAGGICNRETVHMAAMLGADAIQMGTVYLTTREIVETGALSEVYQRRILEADAGGTVVTGESIGLRVRALRNAKTDAILELERTTPPDERSGQEFRRRLEELATGSLCAAARCLDPRSGRTIAPEEVAEQGQFMSGICAGILHEPRSLSELHAELAAPAEFSAARNTRQAPERIAITGMSLVNSLGRSPAEIWEASAALRSGIVEVTAERWDHDRYFDPRPMTSGRTYCRAAAFHDLRPGRRDIGVPPQDYRNMTEATKIALWVADRAVGDAGILASEVDRHRIGVVLSQNVSEMTPASADLCVRDAIPSLIAAVRRVLPLTDGQAESLAEEFAAGRSIQDDTSLLGRLSSMVPGFVCNKFGFTGPSYSVQAACASSLVALHSAVQMMRTGLLDAALVGGGEEPLSAQHFLEFSVLGALAGLSGPFRPASSMSRPFDRQRDGFVLGEGAGMIVIERESVARRRGAHIYGYITGVGASNTDTGMVESSRHSQIRAIRASFVGLPYGPEAVDLVECHATSTRQGDMEEVEALKSLYPADRRTVLAGFKSQIGHTLGAAGISSLIRGVMAMNAGVLPATLNCEEPDPALRLEGSGLVVLKETAPWDKAPGCPRRFQVDAFGFGGSNYVVQLEQAGDWDDGDNRQEDAVQEPVPGPDWPEGLRDLSRSAGGTGYRIVVEADGMEAAERMLTDSGALQNPAALTDKRRRTLARQGVHISAGGCPAAAPAALVFPGQGSQYVGMGRELSEAFPSVRQTLEEAGGHFGFDIPRLLFESCEAELRDTRWQQPAVFALEIALARHLLSFGFRPAALAGHSLGLFAALCVAGVYSFADGCRIVNQRALCMEKAGRLAGEAGSMLAVHAGREVVEPLLDPGAGVHLLNINSPLQTVIGGPTDETLSTAEILSARGIRWSRLPVGMAFHSPMFRTVQTEFADFLSGIPFHAPAIPVLSNHTQGVFPDDAGEIRRILAEHMHSPVDWLANVRTLAEKYQVKTFVEAGPREALGNLIRDTLPGADCIPLCLPSIEAPSFRGAIARLFVSGFLPSPQPERGVSGRTPSRHQPLRAGTTVTSSASGSAGDAGSAGAPVQDEVLEGVIGVILQTTGYDREEVDADMDLRDDLAIRSSRLPVIADALETRFRIKLDLQDFAGVRTVRDVAACIRTIMEKRAAGEGAGLPEAADSPDGAAGQEREERPEQENSPLRRIVPDLEPLPEGETRFLQFSPSDRIGVYCPWRGTEAANAAAAVLRRDHGVSVEPVASPEQAGSGLAGLILWIGGQPDTPEGPAPDEARRKLQEAFLLLQAFLGVDSRKAVLLFHEAPAGSGSRILAEGICGMLLCMAWEYRSVLFRSVRLETAALPESAVRRSLDRKVSSVVLCCRDGELLRECGRETPLADSGEPSAAPGTGDVIAVSGGGAGILREWVRALIPCGCRIVLLGRTELSAAAADDPRAQEIRSLLAELAAAGTESAYFSCDVADPEQTEQALAEAASRFGRITGVVHGAGILRDNFVPRIVAADFDAVVRVKLQGAENLFRSSRERGLRFFAAVSSVAAFNGNPGQTNYAAANRAMTAYLDLMRAEHPSLRVRSLLLAPVEGGGMADTPELRALMRRSGYNYIHAAEAARMFCRELSRGGGGGGTILLARALPTVDTAPPVRPAASSATETAPASGTHPLVDEFSLDLKTASLTAFRTFDAVRDLWLTDHKPLPGLKHPLVSGIMMLEAFAESARLLYPCLEVLGFRDIRFVDIIECPPGQPRRSRIDCHETEARAGRAICGTRLLTRGVSPAGRELDQWTPNARGKVLMGPPGSQTPFAESGFPFPYPLAGDGFSGRTLDRTGLADLYERFTALRGRYRVLDAITGIGADSVEARTIQQEPLDFLDPAGGTPLQPAAYQAAPYLIEAIFHAVDFQTLLTLGEERNKGIVLPYGFASIDIYRFAEAGEACIVQARQRSRSGSGVTWDAVVADAAENVLVAAKGLEMRWLSL